MAAFMTIILRKFFDPSTGCIYGCFMAIILRKFLDPSAGCIYGCFIFWDVEVDGDTLSGEFEDVGVTLSGEFWRWWLVLGACGLKWDVVLGAHMRCCPRVFYSWKKYYVFINVVFNKVPPHLLWAYHWHLVFSWCSISLTLGVYMLVFWHIIIYSICG